MFKKIKELFKKGFVLTKKDKEILKYKNAISEIEKLLDGMNSRPNIYKIEERSLHKKYIDELCSSIHSIIINIDKSKTRLNKYNKHSYKYKIIIFFKNKEWKNWKAKIYNYFWHCDYENKLFFHIYITPEQLNTFKISADDILKIKIKHLHNPLEKSIYITKKQIEKIKEEKRDIDFSKAEYNELLTEDIEIY